MDLSFSLLAEDAVPIAAPGDFATLMVGATQRQSATPTAIVQAGCAGAGVPSPMQPGHGAFNGAMAAKLVGWTKP